MVKAIMIKNQLVPENCCVNRGYLYFVKQFTVTGETHANSLALTRTCFIDNVFKSIYTALVVLIISIDLIYRFTDLHSLLSFITSL